jgi:hypothetical protein
MTFIDWLIWRIAKSRLDAAEFWPFAAFEILESLFHLSHP